MIWVAITAVIAFQIVLLIACMNVWREFRATRIALLTASKIATDAASEMHAAMAVIKANRAEGPS